MFTVSLWINQAPSVGERIGGVFNESSFLVCAKEKDEPPTVTWAQVDCGKLQEAGHLGLDRTLSMMRRLDLKSGGDWSDHIDAIKQYKANPKKKNDVVKTIATYEESESEDCGVFVWKSGSNAVEKYDLDEVTEISFTPGRLTGSSDDLRGTEKMYVVNAVNVDSPQTKARRDALEKEIADQKRKGNNADKQEMELAELGPPNPSVGLLIITGKSCVVVVDENPAVGAEDVLVGDVKLHVPAYRAYCCVERVSVVPESDAAISIALSQVRAAQMPGGTFLDKNGVIKGIPDGLGKIVNALEATLKALAGNDVPRWMQGIFFYPPRQGTVGTIAEGASAAISSIFSSPNAGKGPVRLGGSLGKLLSNLSAENKEAVDAFKSSRGSLTDCVRNKTWDKREGDSTALFTLCDLKALLEILTAPNPESP